MSNGKLTESGLKVASERYFYGEAEDWEGSANRVGRVIASAEGNSEYTEKFAEMIFDMDFLPGGRILRNAGRPRGSLFNCLAKDTEVLTENNGFVKISELKEGESVLNGNGKFDRVKKVIQNGHSDRLLEFVVDGFGKNNTIMCTDNHKFYVFSYNGGFSWKEACDIKPNLDFMVVPKLSNVENPPIDSVLYVDVVVDIHDMYGKEYDIVDGYVRIYNTGDRAKTKYNRQISPIKNEIKVDEAFCKLVGYYLAEGTSIDNGNSVIFSFHEDEVEYQNEVVDLINRYFGLECSIRNNTGKSKQVTVNSQIVNSFFANLFGRKSKSKKLPWWWFSLNNSCLLETLVGGIRGDGRYILNRHSTTVDFATANKLLTYQIFMIGVKLNLATSFTSQLGRKIKIDDNTYYSDIFTAKFGSTKNNSELVCRINNVEFNDTYALFCVKEKSEIDYDDYVYDISMENEDEAHFTLVGGVCHNCYVLPMEDSIEQIGQFMKDALILWSEGGGVGTNISFLRPRGTLIKGKGGHSSGPVSFLEAADWLSKTIEAGGGRRAATLACMSVKHPDIMEFIDAKLTHGKLPGINISVAVTEAFLEAVESNKEWSYRFAQQPCGTVDATEIWDKIITNMVNCAEPGLLNWNNLSSNNSYYFDRILSTNPCGEAPLPPYNVCDLGSIVLPNYITGTVNTNWKKLEEKTRLAVRFLDDVIDVNKYVLSNIDLNAHNSRRIGVGIMGLAEYLFAKKVRYGSPKAIDEVERVMKFIRDTVYDESIALAIEKGAFPKYDSSSYSKAHFVRGLPAKLRMRIKEHGIRNVTLLSIAPCGTISLLPEVTGSGEPLPFKAYMRHDRVGNRAYIHPIYKELLESGEDIPDWFVDTSDLKPEDHFETQVAIQKYTDGAVSKTLNMPKGITTDELSKLMLEYIYDLKGATVYVDGSREGQILNKMTKKEALAYLESNKQLDDCMDESTTMCASGKCEI